MVVECSVTLLNDDHFKRIKSESENNERMKRGEHTPLGLVRVSSISNKMIVLASLAAILKKVQLKLQRQQEGRRNEYLLLLMC